MPDKQTIKTEDGTEVVVYDAAAVDTLIQSKETEFGTQKTALETAVKEANDKLAKADEKGADFAALRTAKEAAEKALAEATDKHTAEVTELKTKPLVEHRTHLTGLLSGTDTAVKDKVEYHLKNTVSAMPETTKEEVDAKVKAAYQLAVGANYNDDNVSRVISGAGGVYVDNKSDLNPDLKQAGMKNFGLNEKDFENAKNAGLI